MYVHARSMHAMYLLLFLVLVVNSDQFQILWSYTLLLKPILLRSSYIAIVLCPA